MDKQNDKTTTVGTDDKSNKDNQADNKEKRKIVRNEPLPPGLLDTDEDEEGTGFDCPVCLQGASFPVELPCHHIFCFLCVKGVANRSKRCALCRQVIPADFLNDPKLLCEDEIKEKSMCMYDDGYQWFYEGRHGWWQYDERTSNELEAKYKNGDKMFELLIAGFLYVIDLENMRQFRRSDQTRRRRIRRDLRSIPGIKGIAGLKYGDSQYVRPSGDGGESSQSDGGNGGGNNTSNNANGTIMMPPQAGDSTGLTGDDSYLTPPAPNNTPQTPMTPADSQPGSLSGSQEDLSIHLQNLNINSNSSSRGSPAQDVQHYQAMSHPDSDDQEDETQPVQQDDGDDCRNDRDNLRDYDTNSEDEDFSEELGSSDRSSYRYETEL